MLLQQRTLHPPPGSGFRSKTDVRPSSAPPVYPPAAGQRRQLQRDSRLRPADRQKQHKPWRRPICLLLLGHRLWQRCTLHEDGARAGGQPFRLLSAAGAEGDTTARHRRQAPTGGVYFILRLRFWLRHGSPHPSPLQLQADALQSASLKPAGPARLL